MINFKTEPKDLNLFKICGELFLINSITIL